MLKKNNFPKIFYKNPLNKKYLNALSLLFIEN